MGINKKVDDNGNKMHDAKNFINLGLIYYDQARNEEAELLFKKGLEIQEKILGSEHPEISSTLNKL